jgi:formate hydrogenlyase subunit 4
MVHEAMVLEYAGRHLLMLELASAVKLVAYLSILSCVFLPWGLGSDTQAPLSLLIGLLAFVCKMTVLSMLLGAFELSIAKMRVFRVPQFLAAALMLALLATLLLFVSRTTT